MELKAKQKHFRFTKIFAYYPTLFGGFGFSNVSKYTVYFFIHDKFEMGHYVILLSAMASFSQKCARAIQK